MARKKRSGPDLAARFAKISEEITTESEKALFAIGTKVKEAAQRLAPVKTGKLASGYAVRMRYRGTQPVAAPIGAAAGVVATLPPLIHHAAIPMLRTSRNTMAARRIMP